MLKKSKETSIIQSSIRLLANRTSGFLLFSYFVILIIFSFPSSSFAVARYAPGETLNPSCGPTDPTCTVSSVFSQLTVSNLISTTTATSTFVGSVTPSGGINAPVIFKGLASTDGSTFSEEVLPDTDWVLGSGWTGDFSSGFANTGSGTLSNPVTATSGIKYKISWVITAYTGGNLNLNFGGATVNTGSASGSSVITAVSAGAFSATIPVFGSFNGTITISIKEIQTYPESIFTIQNSSFTNIFETRIDSTNQFLGLNSGSLNAVGEYNTSFGINSLRNSNGGNNNTAIGVDSQRFSTVSNRNTSIGAFSLASTTSSSDNSMFGYNTGLNITTGLRNTGIGSYALASTTNSNDNVAIGYKAATNLRGGLSTVFIGSNSGLVASNASYNTGVGADSLKALTTGTYNSCVGYICLTALTTGSNNTAMGNLTLGLLTTGGNNTALGSAAGQSLTVGSFNIAIGSQALYGGKSNTYSIAIGNRSQFADATGYNNTSIGANSLESLASNGRTVLSYADYSGTVPGTVLVTTVGSHGFTSGDVARITGSTSYNGVYTIATVASNTFYITKVYVADTQPGFVAIDGYAIDNTALGYYAGKTIITGSRNTFIGSGAGYNALQSTTATNTIAIGYNAFTTASNQVVIGNTSITQTLLNGFVGIATTSPSSLLSLTQPTNTLSGGLWLSGTDGDFRSIYISDTAGVLSFNGGDTAGALNTATLNAAGAWTNASDISYKQNITDLNAKYTLSDLMKISPRFYTMKGSNKPQIGFIAQEMKLVVPEVVEGTDGSMGISYGNLVALVVQAIKELNVKVDNLIAGGMGAIRNLVADSVTAGVGKFEESTVERLKIGSENNPTGFIMYDEDTKEPYCFKIKSGEIVKTKGLCSSVVPPSNSQLATSSPLITLLGNNPAEVSLGTSYIDLGATATDSKGSSLMPDLFSSNVDTTKTGEYQVIWRVHDSSMNYATSTRVVIVTDPSISIPPIIEDGATTTPPLDESGTTTPPTVVE